MSGHRLPRQVDSILYMYLKASAIGPVTSSREYLEWTYLS